MTIILVYVIFLPCRDLRRFKALCQVADGYIIFLIWTVLSDYQVVSTADIKTLISVYLFC